MKNSRLKVLVSVAIVSASLAYLLISSMANELEYFKYVDEILLEQEKWLGVRLRIAGYVKEGSIFHKPGTHDYIFSVKYGEAEIPVVFKGRIPDSFIENAEVVVSGRLREDGIFQGDRVFAKCPSKYEAKENIGQKTHPIPSKTETKNRNNLLKPPQGHPPVSSETYFPKPKPIDDK